MSGRHEQAASELRATERQAAETNERVQISLLRFDHEFFLHGSADMTGIDTLLGADIDPAWRDELLARRLCLDALVRGPGPVIGAVEPIPEVIGAPRTSLHAVLGGVPDPCRPHASGSGLRFPPPRQPFARARQSSGSPGTRSGTMPSP